MPELLNIFQELFFRIALRGIEPKEEQSDDPSPEDSDLKGCGVIKEIIWFIFPESDNFEEEQPMAECDIESDESLLSGSFDPFVEVLNDDEREEADDPDPDAHEDLFGREIKSAFEEEPAEVCGG